jgi:hypothetical protein
MLLNPRRFESFEIFYPWIEVASSVGKLKIAWSITSALPFIFVCDDQIVTEKHDFLSPGNRPLPK